MAAFIGQGPPMMPFDRHVKQPITVRFVQRHVSGRGNVATITNILSVVCKTLTYFKDSMPRTLNISHTFENPAFSWLWQALVVSCKHDSFLLSWGGLAPRHFCFQVERSRTWHTSLPEILYNSTNPTTTLKLLKCFQISVPYASDV